MTYPLEPGRPEMLAMGSAASEFVADFIDGLGEAPAVWLPERAPSPDLLAPPPEGPSDFGVLLDRVGAAAKVVIESAGPGYFAFIPGGGLYTSALAEFLARAMNRFSGMAALAPELTAMEHGVLTWMCRQFRFPGTAGGLITTGGSLATLTAVVAAREAKLGTDLARGTLYVSAHTHHCVARAARVAGLPASAVRTVPATPELRMDPAAAQAMIEADRARGLRPFLLVGTAGTTNSGAVDPLGDLAAVAEQAGLWFHVDGAYGGFFQLTARGRAALAGVEGADSLVLDPHKGMFLPFGTGVLLARDEGALRAAYAGGGHYLREAHGGTGLPDYGTLGPEFTHEYRGLRLWLPLHLHGVAAFRAALDEKLDLAEHAYSVLAADDRLDVPWRPDLSTVVFRLRDGANDSSLAMLDRINASGEVFLSSTVIEGQAMLRLCILSHRTHRERVDRALSIISAAARQS